MSTATSLLRTPMTRSLAYAFGRQAGDNAMRRGGRTAWSEDDADTAALVTNTAMLSAVDIPDAVKAAIKGMLA